MSGSRSKLGSEVGEEDKPLLGASEKSKYPQVFKWKVSALVILGIIAILIVVNILLFFHYQNTKPRQLNLSFIQDIVKQSSLLSLKSQIVNIARNIQQSYQIQYQSAHLIYSASIQPSHGQTKGHGQTKIHYHNNYPSSYANPIPFTLQEITKIFNQNSDHMLYIFQVAYTATGKRKIFAAYLHNSFPVPSYADFDRKLAQYYTFQISGGMKSILMDVDSNTYLLMNKGANPSNCRIYRLNQNQFNIMQSFLITLLPDPTDIETGAGTKCVNSSLNANPINILTDHWDCFSPTQTSYIGNAEKIFGEDYASNTGELISIEVYHLE